MWIDELILKEWICRAETLLWFRCLTPVLSSGNNEETLIQRCSFTLTFCIASNALWGVFFTHASKDDRKSLRLYCVGGGEFLWNDCVRGACFPESLQGIPLSFLYREPASLHRWWTFLFGRCSYTWHLLLPIAMRLSGQNAFQESRGTLYFTLSRNNRSFPACCKPERLIRGCQTPGREHRLQERLASKGGELYEVDGLLGRWFQSGCNLN